MQQPPPTASPLSPPTASPLSPPTATLKSQKLASVSVSVSTVNSSSGSGSNDSALLSLLRERRTDEAYEHYSKSPTLPGPTCLSRLLAQLSHQNTPGSLSRAHSLLRRVRDSDGLHLLDSDSLGLLVLSSSKSPSHLPFSLSLLRLMLRSRLLPKLPAWSSVVSRLSHVHPDDSPGPHHSLRLFRSVLSLLRSLPPHLTTHSLPDTAAFNAALNACANLRDAPSFLALFRDTMPEFGAAPDVLTYNVLIKMLARSNRKDLLVSVLETILLRGLVPCPTTFHSLVAAYVGLNDLPTAEKLVQAMREGRLDLCAVLRSSAGNECGDGSPLDQLVVKSDSSPPPLLPKAYLPNTRIYTILMKGYMKEGRVDDVVRMVRAMQREPDPASRPDHVTYTTVVTALANAGAMDRARSVLDEMVSAGVPPNRITYNVLLKGYCHQLRLDEAKELVVEMARAGIEPNVVSYNILIDGCILVDDSSGALKYFNEMREKGISPSKVSYTTLMKAFALSAQPRLAHKVFDEMSKDPRVKVDRVAWNMLVEGYCRLGLIEEAKKIVERMKESGFEPDVATYGSLANGIGLARRPGEALLLWNEVKERCGSSPPLKPDEGLLDALADVCVRAAFFKKALEIVACMEENGISPNKTKYKRIYVEMHSRMFTSKHASRARQERRSERKRAAEAFKFWLGLPNSYYGSEWRIEPMYGDESVGL